MLRRNDITLRPWQESDLPLLHELRNDSALQVQLMAQPRPNSMSAVREWLSRKSTVDSVIFIIDAGGPVGFVQATQIDTTSRHAYFGICLHRTARGKGVGAIALCLLEQYVADVFGIRKMLLEVLASNEQAITMYRRAGYRDVGTLREHFFSGQFHDVLIMEKLLRA